MNLEAFINAQNIAAKIKDVDQKLFDLENMKTALKSESVNARIAVRFDIFLTDKATQYHLNTHHSDRDKVAVSNFVNDEIGYYEDMKKALEIDFRSL